MAKQDVNFRQGGPLTGDSGERGNSPPGIDSIKPYDDGERAVAANFDRPPENLRQRTEVLRGEMEGQKYLQDGDMRWIMTSGKADGLHDPGTEWPEVQVWEERITDPLARWYFKLRAGVAVVVQPLNTPRVDVQESKTWNFPLAGPFTGSITLTTNRRAYSLANIREVVWQALAPGDIIGTHGVAGFCDLLVSGEDNHILTITINNVGTTQLFHLNAAFLGYAATLSSAGFLGGVDGWSNPLTFVTIADIPPLEVDYIFSKTFDRELHYIQAATFDAFFNVESPPGTFPNCLEDGDTLAVMWDYLVNPNPLLTDGRRQAIPANGPVATEVLVGRLFKTSVHPEWIPLGIPLCKRIKDTLVWLDGTVVIANALSGTYFSENGITVNRIMTAPSTVPITMTSMWYGELLPPAWGNVLSALDGIVADLATSVAKSGAERIGIKTFAIAPPASLYWMDIPGPGGACVFDAVAGLIDLTNTKASLAAGGPAFADPHETVTGRWRFNNHMRIGPDKAFLRDSFGDSNYKLVYRNNCNTVVPVTESNGDIDWSTYSVYERVHTAGHHVDRIEVYGGYLSDLINGNVITTPASGSGVVHVVKRSNDNPTHVIAHRAVGAAPMALTVDSAAMWDNHRMCKATLGTWIDYIRNENNPGQRWWQMDQIVYKGVDFRAEDGAGVARVQVASQPLTVALEGFYVLPTAEVGIHANRVYVSPGRALVDGRPIMKSSRTVMDTTDANFHMNGVTAYLAAVTDDGGAGPDYTCPRWFYVWLRRDGQLCLGVLPPLKTDYSTAIPGLELYRPHPNEVHAPTYEQKDYVLVDVALLLERVLIWGDSFDAAIHVGGGERRLPLREYASGPDYVAYLVRRKTEVDANDGGMISTSLQQNISPSPIANRACRSPGIPVGVSSKAALSYNISLNIPADTGLLPLHEGEYLLAKIDTSGMDECFGAVPGLLADDFSDPIIHHQLSVPRRALPLDSPYTQHVAGRFDIPTTQDNPSYPHGKVKSRVMFGNTGVGATYKFVIQLLGFYWNRAEGLQARIG